MDHVLEIIKTYRDKIEQFPELAIAIDALTKDHQEIRRLGKERKRIVSMTDHEAINHLTGIGGFAQLSRAGIVSGEISKKTLLNYLDRITNSTHQLTNIFGLLKLMDSTKEQLQENSESFNLEELARGTAESVSDELKQGKRKLLFQYDRQNNKPIEIYACKSVMATILGTLMGNCKKYALCGSNILYGIDIHNKDLRIILENDFEEGYIDRNSTHGKNRREGLPIVENLTRTMGGTFGRYSKAQKGLNYEHTHKFGYKGQTFETDGVIFGLTLKIPMSELTESKESPPL